SINANPSSLSAVQGGSATSTISTAVLSGSAETVTLSASGLPAGVTASFNPGSVLAGGSSTLTLDVATSTPTGPYTITVTGTASSATHSTTVTLTLTAAPNDFSIGANPASVSAVQGGSATSTIRTAERRGGDESRTRSAAGLAKGRTASLNPIAATAVAHTTLTVTRHR